MITSLETSTILQLIDQSLLDYDEQDHAGTRAHLTAARCQIAAVINLQAIEAKLAA